jgi:hypothetical protein
MSEFMSKLETVRDKGVAAVSGMVDFMNAFDDFHAYCKEAHEAKAKRQSQPVDSDEKPLLSAYRNQT